MFNTLEHLTINFKQGTLIDDAVEEAFNLHWLLRCEIIFVFNKIRVKVSTCDSPGEVKETFLKKIDKRNSKPKKKAHK